MAGTFNLMDLPCPRIVSPPTIYLPQERIYHGGPRPIPTSNSSNRHYPAYNPTIKECDLEVGGLPVMNDHAVNSRPTHFSNWAQEWAFLFTVMLSSSSTTVLQGVILIMTETIGQVLNATSPQLTWIAAAVGLGSGSFMLLSGKVADELDRKMQLLIGLLSMSAFSLIAAWAPGPIELIVVCGFLGLCTAVIAPPAVGILFAAYPEGPRRNMACGVLGTGNPVGFILGSVSSGLAVKYHGWRASFVVQAIFYLIMATIASWTVPAIPKYGNRNQAIRQFDYAGSIFIILGVALLSAGLTEGPQNGWLSVHVVLMLIFGVFFIISFIGWEYFYENPLLDLTVWRNGNFSLCVICMGFGYGSFITNEFWITLYMQDVQHYAPLQIAARMLPQAIAGVFWSFLGQWLVQKVHGTIVMGIGSAMYLAGAVLLIFIKEDTPYWAFLFPALVITVIGADFQFIVANLYANKQMPTQASLGVGIIQTAYRLSITIGLAITSAVFNTAASGKASTEDANLSYRRVYICSIIFAAISLSTIPFMYIETRARDNANVSTSTTTIMPETNSSTTVNQSPSNNHSTHGVGTFLDRIARFRTEELSGSLGITRSLPLTRPNRPSPLNLKINEQPHHEYQEGISNTQRYDPSLSRARTMNDIAQGLSSLPRWSWEYRPRAGFWKNRRGSQCHWESSSGDIFEVCIKCKEERKIKDEKIEYDIAEGGRGRRKRVMEVEVEDERRFTI